MISGRYVRYRNLLHCVWCDICDAVRRGFRRKKIEEQKTEGYGRWVNIEQGGGITAGIPGVGETKKKEKR